MRSLFNAATLGGCRFLRRDDLGWLAPGAKADILLIDLDRLGALVDADPIKALIDASATRDVHTVIVDGKVLVQDGRLTRVDGAEVCADGRGAPQPHPGRHGAARRIRRGVVVCRPALFTNDLVDVLNWTR